jgi:heme/copper-type cytochrome/quinol oxidase subunit 2
MEYCVPLPPWFGNTEPTFANTEETEVSLRPLHCLRSQAATNWRPGWLLVLSLSLAAALRGDTPPSPQILSIFELQSTPVDSIFHFSVSVNVICTAIFVIVFFLIAYSALRSRARPGDERSEPPQVYGSNRLELALTVIPVLVGMVLFLPAARVIHSVQTEAQPLDAVSAGRHIFEPTSCLNCHTISGTVANGRFGPELTHLMSRETSAAGAATNTHENLRAWIQDSDSTKPGSLMPAMIERTYEFPG